MELIHDRQQFPCYQNGQPHTAAICFFILGEAKQTPHISLAFSSSKAQVLFSKSWRAHELTQTRTLSLLVGVVKRVAQVQFGPGFKTSQGQSGPGSTPPGAQGKYFTEITYGVCRRVSACVGRPKPRSTLRYPDVVRLKLSSQGFKTFQGLSGTIFTLNGTTALLF